MLPHNDQPDGPGRFTPVAACAWYVAASVLMTWPLVTGLTRDIPWDLGDSILNAWIIQRGADHILRFLQGDAGALAGYWNAGIFHPEPLALAFSEHLTAQVVQALPVYAAGGNIILAYNVVFLSTFALSGLGMFLFVREVSGSPRAAFVAGLIYAFAPYRIGQFSHLQVLSSQWMPFVLYGMARYFDDRRWSTLAGATAALVLNNLSCGYYLLYFPPFAALYVGWAVARRARWRDRRMWLQLFGAAVVAGAVTAPFVLPYAEVRARGFEPRRLVEVTTFSADVYGYLTAHPLNRVWGRLVRAVPRPEGELFAGVIPMLLALLALTYPLREWLSSSAARLSSTSIRERLSGASAWLAGGIGGLHVALLILIVATGGLSCRVAGLSIRATSPGRTLLIAIGCFVVLVWRSSRARLIASRAWRSPVAIAAGGLLLAWVLSLGPRPETLGRLLGEWGPYGWLYNHVPGFDGLRVPARFAMLVVLFLSVLAGYGVTVLERWPRFGRTALIVLCLAVLTESTALPIVVNGVSPLTGVVTPSGPLPTGRNVPLVYGAVNALPPNAVLVEFPFGVEDYELRYMLAAAAHGRPLLNGYSGWFPLSYIRHRATLGRALADPDRAWQDLASSGATHAIVHERAFLDDEGARLGAWLTSHGARALGTFYGDRFYRLQ